MVASHLNTVSQSITIMTVGSVDHLRLLLGKEEKAIMITIMERTMAQVRFQVDIRMLVRSIEVRARDIPKRSIVRRSRIVVKEIHGSMINLRS